MKIEIKVSSIMEVKATSRADEVLFEYLKKLSDKNIPSIKILDALKEAFETSEIKTL